MFNVTCHIERREEITLSLRHIAQKDESIFQLYIYVEKRKFYSFIVQASFSHRHVQTTHSNAFSEVSYSIYAKLR